MKKILSLIILTSFTAFAQITITGNDVLNIFAVGNSTTIHQDTLQSMVDIGSTGGGNNWDFTALQSNLTVNLMCVDPNSTPYASDFPNADFCIYNQGYSQGFQADIWTYSSVNGFVDNIGSATTISAIPGFVTTIKNDPGRHTFMNPTTYNSQWSQTYMQTIYINGTPTVSSSVSINSIVDAYGSMTLPGGSSYDALRIREEVSISGGTSVSYTFVAINGSQVNIPAVASNPPTSGVIAAQSTSYNLALTTDVEQISGLPQDFILRQNFPNPFNPSTNIEYSIPNQSYVELKVYDVLGNEVVTLVNEEKSAGVYRANFSGNGLASGLYIAKITSGNYTNSIKMILLK